MTKGDLREEWKGIVVSVPAFRPPFQRRALECLEFDHPTAASMRFSTTYLLEIAEFLPLVWIWCLVFCHVFGSEL
jgi:hypothetical protein